MTTTTQDSQQNKSRPVLKLGLDVDLKHVTATVQAEHQTPKPARRFTPATLTAWVQEKIAAGHTVWTVYESCGFGYTLHDQLVAAGAHSLVISPVRLSPERRRKTDPLDSRQLCLRLTRYVDGQREELPTIRVPSLAEQQRRELGRQGGIDRHGNQHVRTLLVEAVWRLLRFQPQWHARVKLAARMQVAAALKRKTVVALARQLAVDLWRWRTGRATLAALGLLPETVEAPATPVVPPRLTLVPAN